jgi:hypothetical protein
MKKIFLLFALAISITSFSQDRKALLSAALKNSNASDSTFNMRDSVLGHLYYDAESDSMLLADLKSQKYISQADVDFMRAQLKNYKPHVWSSDSIPHSTVVPTAKTPSTALSFKKSVKAWSEYFEAYKSGYFEVSEPIFSKDGTMAVVYVSFQCGANCGNGGATLYKFEKGQWKPVKNCFSWQKQPN